MMKFVVPDEAKRVGFVSWLMDKTMSYSLLYGEVYATPGMGGVICWLPPGNTTLSWWRTLRTGFWAMRSQLSSVETRRFLANMRYTDGVHDRAAPQTHWYLWAIGVEPACQGRGTGAALMRPVLDRASQSRLCCYLETHNARNLAFYQKYGFEVVSAGVVPKRGLRVWAMLRRPR